MNNSIILQDISFKYTSDYIFRKYSYSFTENNIFGISGKNGIGKSTLLKIISGYLQPQEGTLQYNIDNKAYTSKSIYKTLLYYAPYINYNSSLSAIENYKFLSKIRNQKYDAKILDSLIKAFALPNYADKPFDKLSTGTQNKFKLIQNFIFDGKILLFDEPFDNLDETSVENLKRTIVDCHQGKIIIVSSNILKHLEICNISINL